MSSLHQLFLFPSWLPLVLFPSWLTQLCSLPSLPAPSPSLVSLPSLICLGPVSVPSWSQPVLFLF